MEVRPEEVAREKTLGGAIALCAKVAGFELDKQMSDALGCDKAQLSRWHSGTEGIIWPKLEKLMTVCGNDAPLLWMIHARGYDIRTLRKLESETERELRLAREETARLEQENKLLRELMVGRAK